MPKISTPLILIFLPFFLMTACDSKTRPYKGAAKTRAVKSSDTQYPGLPPTADAPPSPTTALSPLTECKKIADQVERPNSTDKSLILTKACSPYKIPSYRSFPETLLKIEPGVVVDFSNESFSLGKNFVLEAIGTEAEPIVLINPSFKIDGGIGNFENVVFKHGESEFRRSDTVFTYLEKAGKISVKNSNFSNLDNVLNCSYDFCNITAENRPFLFETVAFSDIKGALFNLPLATYANHREYLKGVTYKDAGFVILPRVYGRTADTVIAAFPVPYESRGDLSGDYAGNAFLRIEAGAHIKFEKDMGIKWAGKLDILGTPEAPVILEAIDEPTKPGIWAGISKTGNKSSVTITHAVIKNAGELIETQVAAAVPSGACLNVVAESMKEVSISDTQFIGCSNAGVKVTIPQYGTDRNSLTGFKLFSKNSFSKMSFGIEAFESFLTKHPNNTFAEDITKKVVPWKE